jgi:hypothetical protein
MWERTEQRLARSVARYHRAVSEVPERRLRGDLADYGDILDAAYADVREARQRPRTNPGRAEDARRAMARAATLTAHATEAAMVARSAQRLGDIEETTRAIDAVQTLVKAVRELAEATLD